MQHTLFVLACTLFIAVPGVAQNKIYKTTDAQGNTVYSGVPTADAEQVELQPTNTADAVEVRAPEPGDDNATRSATQTRQTAQENPEREDDPGLIVYDNGLPDDVSDQSRQDEIRERIGNRVDKPRPTPLPQPVKPGVGAGGRR